MVLGSIWSLVAIFAFFMVPVEKTVDPTSSSSSSPSSASLSPSKFSADANATVKDKITTNQNATKSDKNQDQLENTEKAAVADEGCGTKDGATAVVIAAANHKVGATAADPAVDSDHKVVDSDHVSQSWFGPVLRLLRRKDYPFFLLYGFCQFGSLLGIQVFLPPLLIESFSTSSLTANPTSTTNLTSAANWTSTANGSSTANITQLEMTDLDGQGKTSLCLSLFGIGGIIGVLGIGFVMSWGKGGLWQGRQTYGQRDRKINPQTD